MRNLKYTRKLIGEAGTQPGYTPDLPENWHQIMDVINVEKRRRSRDLTWNEAEQALRREGVPDVTKALLLLKSMKILDANAPKQEARR